jgi:hypothetical protein
VIFGSPASGLLLWLGLSALLHRQARSLLLSGPAGTEEVVPRVPLLAHAGALLALVSFAAHVGAARSEVTMLPGRAVEARDAFGRTWRLVNQGVSRYDAGRYDVAALALEVTRPDGSVRLLATELRSYLARNGELIGEPVGRRAQWRGMIQDLRVVLDGAADDDVASVRLAFIPLAALWPAGILLMLLAGALMILGQLTALQGAPRARGVSHV